MSDPMKLKVQIGALFTFGGVIVPFLVTYFTTSATVHAQMGNFEKRLDFNTAERTQLQRDVSDIKANTSNLNGKMEVVLQLLQTSRR